MNLVQNMEGCIASTKDWMQENRLKMNDAKTEVIYFGNQVQLEKCSLNPLQIGSIEVEGSSCVKYLGVTLDSNVGLLKHIKGKCRIASYNLYRIRKIRQYLTVDSCEITVQALVISHLDYANSLFINLPKKSIQLLQRVQNMAAKLILDRCKFDSSKESLKELHWLPIEFRIKFKILVILFQCIYLWAPSYLKNLIKIKSYSYSLREEMTSVILNVPKNKCVTFGDRAFSIAGPKEWNSLPMYLRKITKIEKFKKELKTYLFKKAFV